MFVCLCHSVYVYVGGVQKQGDKKDQSSAVFSWSFLPARHVHSQSHRHFLLRQIKICFKKKIFFKKRMEVVAGVFYVRFQMFLQVILKCCFD